MEDWAWTYLSASKVMVRMRQKLRHKHARAGSGGACSSKVLADALGANTAHSAHFAHFAHSGLARQSAHDWLTRSWRARWHPRGKVYSVGTKKMRSDGQARGFLAVAASLSSRNGTFPPYCSVAPSPLRFPAHTTRREEGKTTGGLFGVGVWSNHLI
jgi:hypothetical protein